MRKMSKNAKRRSHRSNLFLLSLGAIMGFKELITNNNGRLSTTSTIQFFGFAKLRMTQFQNQLNERYQQQQKNIDKVEGIERQIHDLNATLPLNYVLREDYIRGQAIIEAKLDAVHKP